MITRRTATALLGLGLVSTMARPARAASPSPVVATRHGPVVGASDGPTQVFKGIRYGADTGPYRFQPPRLPDRWAETVEALAYGPACPQNGGEPNQAEDCLFLNVWTPGTDAAARPVMVYIHGGAYATGSGSDPLYDGTGLSRRGDVVVVTLNHRLNLFGHAFLKRLDGSLADSGNVGILDLIQALEWVRDNIAAFGGDPGRVMVFGQSGGGAKIATLMATPAAAGLFHAVATMSGQQVTASGPNNATTRTRAWLAALGLDEDRVAELATMDTARLLQAARTTDPVLGYGSLYFGPVLDGRTLVRHPFYPDAPSQSAAIPMIIGNTREETLAFMGPRVAPVDLTWEDLAGRMTPDVLRVDAEPGTVIAAYRAMHPDWSPHQVLVRATTAGRSWRAAVIEAELRAEAGHPTWVYQLDLPGTLEDGRTGAFHTADIPLVFGTLDRGGARMAGPDAQVVSDRMSDAFIALARNGAPGPVAGQVWPRFDLADRPTMIFDRRTRVENDPRGDERRFFARYPYVQPGT
ncbi:MAG: carboxylesterase [Alphaproteobacteria bacterium]|nr:MAG: carboxylesterase [Alphaproteobacteria bacterium]PZO40433.1 MAG: carboxylesterase [Alphaproteobacteria bacterium]